MSKVQIFSIQQLDREKILNALLGTPPIQWLAFCDTDDRREHWEELKLHFQIVHSSLKAYFSGDPNPLQGLDPDFREYAMLLRDYYLSLYKLLHDGWNVIYQEFVRSMQQVGGDESELWQTPGEMFLALLENDALRSFCHAFPESTGNYYAEFPPRKLHDFHRKRAAVEALRNRQKPLTKPERARVASCEKQIDTLDAQILPFKKLEYCCLQICANHAERDRGVKRALKEFEKAQSELIHSLISQYHPRKRFPAHAWRYGEKLNPQKGGSYA